MRKIQMPIPYITLVLHGVWCFIFLNKLEWKAEGAAAVQFLQFFVNFGISEYIISKYASHFGDGEEDKHTSPDLTISEGIDMIMHGIPSALYEIISRISNEAPTFVAGFIAVELVMVNSAFVNLFWLFFCIALGIQITSGSIIGNKIGEGDKEGAKRAIRSTILLAAVFGIFTVVTLFTFRDFLLAKYAKSEHAIDTMNYILPSFAAVLFVSIMKDILFGILIGIGAQNETTKMNITINFFVWAIIMYTLTFYKGYYYHGPWISLFIVGLISSVLLYRIIHNTDFDKLINKVSEDKQKKTM
mmetsp:Transcript_39501/g.39062  ORF Transcript_39501/g.39062 Transcript_39501/m.39062 type:complete len:301 (-) Transcript_39501:92-994(-)